MVFDHDTGKEEPEPPKPNFEGRHLEPGDADTFTFLANGEWHPSPFIAFKNDRLRVSAVGISRALEDNVIEFRVGRLSQIVTTKQDFTITLPGPIMFRLDPIKTAGYSGDVQVEVRSLP
jgi:hypothetical protein